jgi:hypothetical protein
MKHTLHEVEAVQRKLEAAVAGKEGVNGIGIGVNAKGDDFALTVFCSDPKAAKSLPASLDGVEVVADLVGEISAY